MGKDFFSLKIFLIYEVIDHICTVEHYRGINYGETQKFLNDDACTISCTFKFLQSIMCPGTGLLHMVISRKIIVNHRCTIDVYTFCDIEM